MSLIKCQPKVILYTQCIVLFFLGWDIFPSLGFCIVSIWGCFNYVSVTWGIRLFLRGWEKNYLVVYKPSCSEPDFLLVASSIRLSAV